LNKTELKAKEWLTQQGKAVDFHSRSSPDFTCRDGTGYEVKLLRENCITFSMTQFEQLRLFPGELKVVVFDGGIQPDYIIPFSELENIPRYWNGIRVKVFSPKEEITQVRNIDPDLYTKVKVDAAKKKITVGEWFNQAIILKFYTKK
jgi:hypothetical protein